MTMSRHGVIAISTFALLWSCSLNGSLAFLPSIQSTRSLVPRYTSHRYLTTFGSDGLQSDEEFRTYNQVDQTLRSLAEQLPYVLLKPLSTSAATLVYAENVTLLGPKGETLASSLEELVLLSTTLVAATTATRQASSLASIYLLSKTEFTFGVTCEFVLDPSCLLVFQVKWNTQLLGGGSTSSQVQGLSELTLDTHGKVAIHKLLNVEIDGREINAVGETLATVRRAVQSASSLFQNVPFVPILNELREELTLRVLTTSTTTTMDKVLTPTWTVADQTIMSIDAMTLDQYTQSALVPLPGSSCWDEYSNSYTILKKFMSSGITILSNSPSKESIQQIFAAQAQLCGIHGSILCQGGTQVANFYRTLASLRQGPLENWNVQSMVGDWKTRSVIVSWSTQNPIALQGKDCFSLDEQGLIKRVQQMELVVAGTSVDDPEWFRALVKAIEAGNKSSGADIFLDLLQQVNPKRRKAVPISFQKETAPLSEAAAASVYNILIALHSDIALLGNLTAPPADSFCAPDIELRGYLKEILAQGDSQYRRVVGVSLVSFRTALRSGRLSMDQPPTATIEFQADRSIRLSLVLRLQVKVVDEVALPLKLELVSVYKTNEYGRIQEHRLVESRVNDQLTPGDVIIQWLTQGPPSLNKFTKDALNWMR